MRRALVVGMVLGAAVVVAAGLVAWWRIAGDPDVWDEVSAL